MFVKDLKEDSTPSGPRIHKNRINIAQFVCIFLDSIYLQPPKTDKEMYFIASVKKIKVCSCGCIFLKRSHQNFNVLKN